MINYVVYMQVSGDAILKGLQAALENAPSALAARSVLEGFDTAIRYVRTVQQVLRPSRPKVSCSCDAGQGIGLAMLLCWSVPWPTENILLTLAKAAKMCQSTQAFPQPPPSPHTELT